MSEADRQLYGALPPGVVGEITHFSSIFADDQRDDRRRGRDADEEAREDLARYKASLRKPTNRKFKSSLHAFEEFRQATNLPPMVGHALHIIARDRELEGKRVPLATRMKLIDVYRQMIRHYKREQKQELKEKLNAKIDALIRIRTRQRKAEALTRKNSESDLYPGFPKGGLHNRFDYRYWNAR
jgi:hypothetical protein